MSIESPRFGAAFVQRWARREQRPRADWDFSVAVAEPALQTWDLRGDRAGKDSEKAGCLSWRSDRFECSDLLQTMFQQLFSGSLKLNGGFILAPLCNGNE
jgi:hypothetical protein